uniref:Uncharacterized protein n=1 Tax=Spironucleus salmonicida TaxID=348837 RepID=V6LQE4_9EUKA|eukprot:EST46805.1 Hypothetical protein SS50377_13170 [Spironucleus salmonicida]
MAVLFYNKRAPQIIITHILPSPKAVILLHLSTQILKFSQQFCKNLSFSQPYLVPFKHIFAGQIANFEPFSNFSFNLSTEIKTIFRPKFAGEPVHLSVKFVFLAIKGAVMQLKSLVIDRFQLVVPSFLGRKAIGKMLNQFISTQNNRFLTSK